MGEEEKMQVIRNKTHKEKTGIDFTSFLAAPDKNSDSGELSVEVQKLPERNLIFIPTTLGSTDQIIKSFKKVKQWAEVRELSTSNSEVFGLLMNHPLFTALDKCRYLACISLDIRPKLSGNIQYMELPARTYASFEVTGDINDMIQKITIFGKTWLPESGYKIVHEPAIHLPKHDISTVPFNENSFKLHLRIKPR